MNLIKAERFGLSIICVDVHADRISNRLGLVKTKTFQETEVVLKKLLQKNIGANIIT